MEDDVDVIWTFPAGWSWTSLRVLPPARMQMMMLESMIAAYTMSTMSVDGTRPSEPHLAPIEERPNGPFSIYELFGAL